MARPKMNCVILDPGSGKARPGAYVTVYLANTLTKATLYADDDVSTVQSDPGERARAGGGASGSGVYDISMIWDGAQPTVVEDVLAWTPVEALMTEPGDIIIGGPDGEAVRLPLGTRGSGADLRGRHRPVAHAQCEQRTAGRRHGVTAGLHHGWAQSARSCLGSRIRRSRSRGASPSGSRRCFLPVRRCRSTSLGISSWVR